MTGTAERVSRDASDNFVFARSVLAYIEAAGIIANRGAVDICGDKPTVLEIGTGSGYGVDIIAPKCARFTTVDKHNKSNKTICHSEASLRGEESHSGTLSRKMTVPPLDFPDNSFDFVVSFQVIEHIKDDRKFLAEVARVLRPGGKFIVSTPNAPMSLTRNPWHVREYTAEGFSTLLKPFFAHVEALGVVGNERVMEYYERNREAVKAITRLDPLKLQYHAPRWMLKIPYDIANRINRRRLLADNVELTSAISPADYRLAPETTGAFDLFYIATK